MILHETPIVSAQTSTGKTKYWIGRVLDEAGQIVTRSEYWQEGAVHQFSAPTVIVAKQKRSVIEQAIAEITSDLQKKADKGYLPLDGSASDDPTPPILPMLAHDFAKRAKELVYPCFAQAKENGFRALYDGVFWSRQGNQVIPDCVRHLSLPELDGWILDGELVLPSPHSFQDTVRALKKFRPGGPLVEYRIFDAYHPERPEMFFIDRWIAFNTLLASPPPFVHLVSTTVLDDPDELQAQHRWHVEQGVEGTMLRNTSGVYKPGHRSVDLLKLKDTLEEDYPIAGYTEGVGKDVGAIVFTCRTPDGKLFNVRPKGSIENRQALFQVGDDLIGKLLTVKHQALSEDGVPIFPVGLTIRDYE